MPHHSCTDGHEQNIGGVQENENRRAAKARRFYDTKVYEEFPTEYEETIQGRFEKIVGQYPDRLAVKMGGRSLTYNELNRAANRIAHAILAQRGNNSEPVALLFENGIDVIAAMLGALKAGRFCVALDLSFPQERIRYILKDSLATYIITNQQNLPVAQRLLGSDGVTLNVDDIDPFLDPDNLTLSLGREDLSAITYTSGSTGTPKGVVETHGFRLGVTQNHCQFVSVRPDDRLALVHSVSFSSAYIQLFSSLLTGASIWPFDLKNKGMHEFAEWLFHNRITVLHLPPMAFRQLSEFIKDPKRFDFVRVVRLSGAPITKHDFDMYKKYWPPQASLAIHMGSTEAGTIAQAVMDQTFQFPEHGTPVGFASPDKTIVLVDEKGQPAAPEEAGELIVKGRYLTAGYWEHFKTNGFKVAPPLHDGHDRVYATGDIARMQPDGFFVHVGRKDFMVKIRGYRVELGEIETALLSHPRIKNVGVATWERNPGEKYLVAYVVPRDGTHPTVSELHGFVKGKLPEYMVPSSYMFLDSLPLTNGKLDRSQLPLPDDKRPDLGQPYVPPQTDVERSLIEIWQEVLDVHPIGIHDDFFELGGHSLLAAKLFGRIEKKFGKKLLPSTLLYTRTIKQLSDHVCQGLKPESSLLLVPLQPNGTKPPFFWAGGFSCDIHLPRLLGQDQPLYGLLNQCHDGHSQLYNRLEDIAAHHVKEIRGVQPQGPYYLGGYCFGGMVAFEMAQQLKQQGQEVALLFLLDLATVINVKSFNVRIPGCTQTEPKTYPFRDKAARHIRALAKLSLRDKLMYVRVRLVDRKNSMVTIVKNVFKELLCRACLLTGRPIPTSLQLFHISTVDHQVMGVYRPQRYTGSIIHIKAEASRYDPRLVTKLAGDTLEAYEMSCNHDELAQEPHISIWAEWLKSYLNRNSGSDSNALLTLGDHALGEQHDGGQDRTHGR